MPINCNHEIFSAYMQISSLSLSITSTSAAAASAASSSSSSSLKLAFACKRALLLHQLRNPSHFLNQCYFSLLPTNRLASSRRICSHMNNKLSSASSHEEEAETEMGSDMKMLPVLLFDVMGTIVRDPFYEDVPAFFGLSMKELLAIKHPTAWIEFEKGHLAEDQLKEIFFNDGRGFDFSGLKDLMLNGYQYLEGMEELLSRLKVSGYQMHAFTNYPSWYNMVEDKLKLSQYLSWTFVSCHTGWKRGSGHCNMATSSGYMMEGNDRLTSSNYSLWNVRMKSLLEMNDVLDIVVGLEERPTTQQEQLRSKHIEVAYHFVREQAMAQEVELQHVSSRECVADIFTKALGKDLFMKHRTSLGVLSKFMLKLVEEGV